MKKLAKLLLVGALALGSLQAKELFNLKAQDFEHTLGENSKNAKYKVGDVVIETNLLKRTVGYYRTNVAFEGYFNIEFLNLINKWTLNYDFTLLFNHNHYDTARYIQFTDETGKSILLEFNHDGFNFNGKKFKANISGKPLLLNISNNNKFKIKVNNQTAFNDSIAFGKLKYIDTNCFTGNNIGDLVPDKLNNIILVSHD